MRNNILKNQVDILKSLPWWGWLVGPLCVAVNETFYLTAPLIAKAIGTTGYAFEPVIPAIDGIIPLIPAFVLIYIFSFYFWIKGLITVSLTGKKNLINTLFALFATFLTSFLIFIFLPTKQDRAGLGLIEAVSRPGIFNRLMLFIYNCDGGENATNMLPSQHVMYSVFCYLGIRKQPAIAKGFRIYSFIMMSLIILATLFTKQHYVLDILSAIALSLFWYKLIFAIDPYERLAGRKKRQ